jgi:hypothetical protein
MKFLRYVVIFGLLSLSSYVAMADGVGDPRMTPIGGGRSTVLTSPTDPAFVISYTATVTPTVGCGAFDGSLSDDTCIDPHFTDFVNNSGVAWKAIQFDIKSVAGDITQSSFSAIQDPSVDPYFLFASTTTNAAGDTILSFFGTDSTHPGILPATGCDGDVCTGPFLDDTRIPLFDFGILVDVNDALTKGDSFTAQGTASTVPEPSSLLLFLTGGAIFLILKRC